MREESTKILNELVERELSEDEVCKELEKLLKENKISEDDIKEYFNVDENGKEDKHIQLDIGNIIDFQIDGYEFQKGLKLGSYYAGIFTALCSSGMDSADAYSITLNQNTIDGNKMVDNF